MVILLFISVLFLGKHEKKNGDNSNEYKQRAKSYSTLGLCFSEIILSIY